jgi:hypothetical protein
MMAIYGLLVLLGPQRQVEASLDLLKRDTMER